MFLNCVYCIKTVCWAFNSLFRCLSTVCLDTASPYMIFAARLWITVQEYSSEFLEESWRVHEGLMRPYKVLNSHQIVAKEYRQIHLSCCFPNQVFVTYVGSVQVIVFFVIYGWWPLTGWVGEWVCCCLILWLFAFAVGQRLKKFTNHWTMYTTNWKIK